MGLRVTVPPATEPITDAQVMAQGRLDSDEEASLRALYIGAAREACERFLNRALITRTLELTLDAFPAAEIQIPLPRARSIVSITYVDTNGVVQTLAGDAYLLDADGAPSGWILPAYGTSWPATMDVVNAVKITFTAGYGDAADDVPQNIRLWLLMVVAYFDEYRSVADVSCLPTGLIDSEKVYL